MFGTFLLPTCSSVAPWAARSGDRSRARGHARDTVTTHERTLTGSVLFGRLHLQMQHRGNPDCISGSAISMQSIVDVARGNVSHLREMPPSRTCAGQVDERAQQINQLIEHAANGDLEAVQKWTGSPDVRATHPSLPQGCTMLIAAAANGHIDTVCWLCDHAGASVDLRAEGGVTALMFACTGGDCGTLQALLARGANPLRLNEQGWSAQQIAADAGHRDAAALLQSHELAAQRRQASIAASLSERTRTEQAVAVAAAEQRAKAAADALLAELEAEAAATAARPTSTLKKRRHLKKGRTATAGQKTGGGGGSDAEAEATVMATGGRGGARLEEGCTDVAGEGVLPPSSARATAGEAAAEQAAMEAEFSRAEAEAKAEAKAIHMRELDERFEQMQLARATSSSSLSGLHQCESGEEAADVDEHTCVICFDETRDATIVHGGTAHVCCCLRCAEQLQQQGQSCPMCRLPIESVLKLFFA